MRGIGVHLMVVLSRETRFEHKESTTTRWVNVTSTRLNGRFPRIEMQNGISTNEIIINARPDLSLPFPTTSIPERNSQREYRSK